MIKDTRSTPCCRFGGLTRAVLLVALLALSGWAAALSQQPRQPVSKTFIPIGAYVFQYDGKSSSEAKIYHSPGEAAILVRAPELSSPFLLVPRTWAVLLLEATDLKEHPDGSVDLAPGAKRSPAGTFKLVGDHPVFQLGGKDARFLPKPHLLGPQDGDALKAHSPEYVRKAAAFKPYPNYLSNLKSLDQEVRVKVYFASWCHTCAQLMPNVLRIADELQGSRFTFEYYGLSSPLKDDPEAQRTGIQQLPTGIVYIDGKEVGRVLGYSWRYPGMALSNTLGR